MYYEERWIDGKFCWRTSPNGAWTAYTANELAHRYQAELQRAHDLQRALDAEREKVKAEQEQWEIQAREGGRLKDQLATLQAQLAAAQNEIDTATDQIPARMDGDSLSVALIKLKDSERDITNQMVTLQAQLRQAEGQSQQQAEEAVIVFAKYTTLRQLVEAFVQHFDDDFENPGLELYGRVNGKEICEGGKALNELLAKARATLLSAAGKQMEVK